MSYDDAAFDRWQAAFREKDEQRDQARWRVRRAVVDTARAVDEWAKQQDVSPDYYLDRAEDFVERLDMALHDDQGPFTAHTNNLWHHVDLAQLYQSTKVDQRRWLSDYESLKLLATEYLKTPSLQTPYLDWVFVDALVATELVLTMEAVRTTKIGVFGYTLFGDSFWKLGLWKLGVGLLNVAVSWVLPALVAYWTFNWSPWLAIGGIVFAYGLNLFLLLRYVWFQFTRLFSKARAPLDKLGETTELMGIAYSALKGEVVHCPSVRRAIESAAADGAVWDPQVFYILDNVAKRQAPVWEVWPVSEAV